MLHRKSLEANRTVDKALVAVSCLSITLALAIMAVTPAATGYEISTYDAYPLLFWVLILLSISCGVCILFRLAFSSEPVSKWWLLSTLAVVVPNLIVILLPLARGYFLASFADSVVHFGHVTVIAETGGISLNLYPITHIVTFELAAVFGLTASQATLVTPAIFYLVYVVGLFLLFTWIGPKRENVFLALALGSVLQFSYFSYVLLPTQVALYCLPFIVALFFFRNALSKRAYSAFLVIATLFITLTHPLGAVQLIMVVLLLATSVPLYNVLVKRHFPKNVISYPLSKAVVPAALGFALFLAWCTNFLAFQNVVERSYTWITYGEASVPLASVVTAAGMLSLADRVQIAGVLYGNALIYIALAVVAILMICKRALSHKRPLLLEEVFFTLVLFAFVVFFVITETTGIIFSGATPRVLYWVVAAAAILCGFTYLSEINSLKPKLRRIGVTALAVIVLLATIAGMLNVYVSPISKQPGTAVSAANWDATTWFYKYRGSAWTIALDELTSNAPQAIFGPNTPASQSARSNASGPAPHLGYDTNTSFSSQYGSNGAYLVVTDRTREYKTLLWPDIGTYTLRDLSRLDNDTSVTKFFSNGGADIYWAA